MNPQTRKLARMWKGPCAVLIRCGPVSFRVIDKEGYDLPDAVHTSINSRRSLRVEIGHQACISARAAVSNVGEGMGICE